MRLCRFGNDRLGVVEGVVEGVVGGVVEGGVERGIVRDITAALDVLPAYRYPFPAYDILVGNLDTVKARAKEVLPGAPAIPLAGVKLLSPVANPGKIIAAPVNYQKHLDEVKGDSAIHAGNPAHTVTIQTAGLFLKATSSLAGAGDGIAVVKPDRRTDHEVELVVVIGRQARHVSRADALRHVAGYCIGLDVSIRGSEDRSFRKSPDSYSMLGPWLVTADDIPDPGVLDLEISVNGTLRQKSNTRYLILGVPELIELASSFYTLYPGDVIFTGTPEGVSPIQPGDEVSASVERIGTMDVRVRAADAPGVPAMSASAHTRP